MAAAFRGLFRRQSANRADVANEDGPAPGDVVVTGVPVDSEVAQSEAVSSASAAAASVDLTVMTQQVRDQRAEIAEALVRNMRQFRPNICLLSNDQILRHACDIAMAPDWMQNTYNTEVDFTWAFAGFNVLLSSFFPGGTKTKAAMDEVAASP